MEGLRERKRRLTRDQLERAAVDIAFEEGIAAVTVERVCAAAMVSRSTFFNYFSSLSQAIFGTALVYDRELTQRVLTRYSHDLVTAAGLIVMETVRGDPNDEMTQRRFALFGREPGVTNAVSWAAKESREGLIKVIAQWLDAHPEDRSLSDADSATEARIVVSLSIVLGDEMQRLLGHTTEFPVDAERLAAARRRLADVAARS